MAQKLSKQLGRAVGISAEDNTGRAAKLREQLGPESVVTLLCDSYKKCLSTDLVQAELVRAD